jgi:hypothetical protein
MSPIRHWSLPFAGKLGRNRPSGLLCLNLRENLILTLSSLHGLSEASASINVEIERTQTDQEVFFSIR